MKDGDYDKEVLTEIRFCKVCSSQSIGEKFYGDEGWTICEDCGTIEGESKYLYQDERGYYQCRHLCGRRWLSMKLAFKCKCRRKRMKINYCKKCLFRTPKSRKGICKICKT